MRNASHLILLCWQSAMEKLGACPSKTVDMSRDDVSMVVASCLVSELHLKEGIEIMVCSHLVHYGGLFVKTCRDRYVDTCKGSLKEPLLV
jgi:hypothetical protein